MIEKESSTVASVRGVQSPGGNKTKKDVVDVSQPYEEMDPDLFEQLVIEAELTGQTIDEVVRKKGNLFVHFDDDDNHEIASYRDRKSAWEHQRNYRKRKELEKGSKKEKKKKEKEHEKTVKQLFGKKRKSIAPPPEKKTKKEGFIKEAERFHTDPKTGRQIPIKTTILTPEKKKLKSYTQLNRNPKVGDLVQLPDGLKGEVVRVDLDGQFYVLNKETQDGGWVSKNYVFPLDQQTKKEELTRMFTKILSEGTLRENVLEYVFENPTNQDVLEWDNFLKGLSKQSIMSDPKLKIVITNLMKSEARILNKSMSIIKSRLQKAGFEVSKSKVSADNNLGRLRGEFLVTLPEAKKTLPFGIRIENGRSLIFIPNETKQLLNTMGTPESKAIRAELIYTQENDLDTMDDVVKATEKRDKYFSGLEKNLDKMMTDLSPVELAVIRKLLKTKFKNV